MYFGFFLTEQLVQQVNGADASIFHNIDNTLSPLFLYGEPDALGLLSFTKSENKEFQMWLPNSVYLVLRPRKMAPCAVALIALP